MTYLGVEGELSQHIYPLSGREDSFGLLLLCLRGYTLLLCMLDDLVKVSSVYTVDHIEEVGPIWCLLLEPLIRIVSHDPILWTDHSLNLFDC